MPRAMLLSLARTSGERSALRRPALIRGAAPSRMGFAEALGWLLPSVLVAVGCVLRAAGHETVRRIGWRVNRKRLSGSGGRRD